jgi:hypothetical protein
MNTIMRWQYRTIVFEFQKDGLLGDRFIDDEGVEQTLNEQGRAGWELVSATMVREGLLTMFKRPDQTGAFQEVDQPAQPVSVTEPELQPVAEEIFSAETLQQEEQEHIRNLENQRRRVMEAEEQFMVGDIKIC